MFMFSIIIKEGNSRHGDMIMTFKIPTELTVCMLGHACMHVKSFGGD